MKITLSKTQWELIGKKTGWNKSSQNQPVILEETFPGSSEVMVFKRKSKEPYFVIRGASIEDLDKNKIREYLYQVDWTDKGAKGYITPDLKCDDFMKTASLRKNIKSSQTDPTTKIITDHILQKQKMLHAIDLAIPCLQDWTSSTERGEIFQRDMKALKALEESIKGVEHLRGHGFKYHQDQDGWV